MTIEEIGEYQKLIKWLLIDNQGKKMKYNFKEFVQVNNLFTSKSITNLYPKLNLYKYRFNLLNKAYFLQTKKLLLGVKL